MLHIDPSICLGCHWDGRVTQWDVSCSLCLHGQAAYKSDCLGVMKLKHQRQAGGLRYGIWECPHSGARSRTGLVLLVGFIVAIPESESSPVSPQEGFLIATVNPSRTLQSLDRIAAQFNIGRGSEA